MSKRSGVTTKVNSARSQSRASESLGDDAYEWLIAAITSFRIPTNSQISENKLAAELGVSRTPVREALKRLENEGLVKRGVGGSFVVAMLSAKDVDEAIDLMVLCDVYLFQRAAQNIDSSGRQTLAEAAKKMSVAAVAGDRETWMEHDQVFHECIMRAADNNVIAEVSRVTRRRIQRFWARSISGARDLVSCSDEHREIAQAISTQDMAAIQRTVESHLGHLRENMHEIVELMAPFLGDQ